MQNRLSKFAGILLATLVVLGILPIIPVFAVDPHIYLVPSSNYYTTDTASPGDKFTVTAYVDDVVDLNGWQIALYYNASVINCTQAVPLFVLVPGMPLGPAFDYFDSWGVGFVGSTGMTGSTPFTGSNKALAEFEFEIIASPPKWGSLTSDLVISYKPAGGAYDCKLKDSTGAAMTFTATDGDYEYAWAPPPLSWWTVDPDVITYDEYTNWTATPTTFTIDIVLNSISTAWELVNVTLDKTFDPTLLSVVSVTEGPFLDSFGPATFDYAILSDRVYITGELDTPYPMVFPSGTGVIATIEFLIIFQGAFGDDRSCTLDFENIGMLDKDGLPVTYDYADPATYTIKGYMAMAAPYLEVEDVTVGPEPVQCTFVDVNVWIRGLDARWNMTAPQFRLTYDPEIVEVVQITNGSFMSAWGPTLPMSANYPTGNGLDYPEPHLMYAELLLPPWTVFPEGEGILATITFHILKQYMEPDDIVMELNFLQIKLKDALGDNIPVDWGQVKNGTLTILGWSLAGRVIDVYTQYPEPYGGQGPMEPSDMFWPQKEVWLYANVTYNWWPVQQKDVTFEVRDPSGELWTVLVATTNDVGVASVSFRIPWPCDDPESLFGVWTVIASVDISCEIVKDWLWFHFDYLVRITGVQTDKTPPEYYKHCEWITIRVDYASHAQQCYPVTFTVVIHDDQNVPIGQYTFSGTVGGAVFCEPNTWYFETEIHVPKFAFPGIATIYVSCLSALPSECGFAYCPGETATAVIYPGWVGT